MGWREVKPNANGCWLSSRGARLFTFACLRPEFKWPELDCRFVNETS